MLRYYNPEKVELMGQKIFARDAQQAIPPPRRWNNVAVISNGIRYMAIDVSYEEGIAEVKRMQDEEDYIFASYYRIPFKFLHHFFGSENVPNPTMPK